MRFFLDNCLSPLFAKSLHILSERDGHEVVHLSEKFDRNTTDPIWIRKLRDEGEWVIVSGDVRISTTPHLKAEWLNSGLTAFFLSKGWMNVPFWRQAGLLLYWWPIILDQARIVEPGAGFEVPFKSPGRLRPIR